MTFVSTRRHGPCRRRCGPPTPRRAAVRLNALQHGLSAKLEVIDNEDCHEAKIERAFYRTLHELQRLQAQRAGHHVPPPTAADIDVTLSETSPGETS